MRRLVEQEYRSLNSKSLDDSCFDTNDDDHSAGNTILKEKILAISSVDPEGNYCQRQFDEIRLHFYRARGTVSKLLCNNGVA